MSSSTASSLNMARFEKFGSHAKVEFWSTLHKKKIHDLRLSDAEIPLNGTFQASREAADTGRVELDGHSFYAEANAGLFEYVIPGSLRNFNTIEEYNAINAKEVLATHAAALWETIVSGEFLDNPGLLFRFHVYSFADLKAHEFHSRTVLPILSPVSPIHMDGALRRISALFDPEELTDFQQRWDVQRGVGGDAAGPLAHVPVFCYNRVTHALTALASVREEGSKEALNNGTTVVCVADCCGTPHFGWAVRNVVLALRAVLDIERCTCVSIREGPSTGLSLSLMADFVITADLGKDETGALPSTFPAKLITPFGWETAKPAVNLAKAMDPNLLSEESAKLNLSLMKWRMVPDLDLEKISNLKCLVVGSGTLGCGVARNLMKWGIFEFTMVDRGNVSFSNTVRQSLFVHEDAVLRKNKAQAAADACKKIYPLAKVSAVDMNIPMPGHAVSSDAQEKEVRETVDKFEELIKAHDVIFLLTDSRESRWLPTLLGTKHKKIVLNAALGFNTYVVMRHGHPDHKKRLSCYFCSDITSPIDSISDRTLDQQCTVTRPGVSDIASASIVELLVSIVSHPDGASADPPCARKDEEGGAPGPLGTVPHQVRGGLYEFDQMTLYGPVFPSCVGCSDAVLNEYSTKGFQFIKDVLNNPTRLTEVSGINTMLEGADDLGIISDEDDESE